MARQKTERQIERDNRFGRPLEWVAGAAVGLVTGTVTFYNLVTTKFHNDISGDFGLLGHFRGANNKFNLSRIFTDMVPKTRQKYLLNVTESEAAQKFKQGALARPDGKVADDFLKNISGAKKTFRDFTRRIAHYGLGIESYGVKGLTVGTWQRLRTFSPTSRFTTVFKGLFAVGAGLGVTLMAFNQLNTRDKLNELTKTTSNTNDKLDTLLHQHGEHHREFQQYRTSSRPMGKAEALLAQREHDASLGEEGHAL